MLETYHSGAYGSLVPDKWSCCECKGHKQMGCRGTADNPMELERFRERRFSPPEPIPRRRGGMQFKFNGMTLYNRNLISTK